MALARILLYTATAPEQYRHDSIPNALSALKSRAAQHNFIFDATEDPTYFTEGNLTKYDALAFILNTGDILDADGISAFQSYLDKGGNFIGVHSACASLTTTPFYQKTLGALFDYHPDMQNATFTVLDANHPSTSMLPPRWKLIEEVYNFMSDPRDVGAKVLLSVDETSYIDGNVSNYTDGTPHPIAWYQDKLAGVSKNRTDPNGLVGRSWYSSLGHYNLTWQDETFLEHMFGGMKWAVASNTTLAFNPNAKVGYPSNPPTPSIGTSSTPVVTTNNNSGARKGVGSMLAGLLTAGTLACAVSVAQVAFLLY